MLRKLRYPDQLDYIRSLKKPGPMSVDNFNKAIIRLNRYAVEFPDAPAGAVGIDNDEKKRLFFHAMPKAWQDKFEESKGRYYSRTFGNLRSDGDPRSYGSV